MTAREYAKSQGFEIVGSLRRIGDYVQRSEIDNEEIGRSRVWIDNAGNEFWYDTKRKQFCIVTHDGGVN